MFLSPTVSLLVNWIGERFMRLRGIESRLNDDVVRAVLRIDLKWFFSIMADVIESVADNDVDALLGTRIFIKILEGR